MWWESVGALWPGWRAHRAGGIRLGRWGHQTVWRHCVLNSRCLPHFSDIFTIFPSSLGNCRLCITSGNSLSRIWLPGLKRWVLLSATRTEKKIWTERIIFHWNITFLNWGWFCLKINYFMPENVFKECTGGKKEKKKKKVLGNIFPSDFFLLSKRKL